MIKRMNRVISLLLCLAIVCCQLPGVRVSAAGLEATNLTWGSCYWVDQYGTVTEEAMPGTIKFTGVPYTLYFIEYYKVGEDEYPVALNAVYADSYGRADDERLTIEELSNGNYYFVVTPIDEGQFIPIGDSVTSGTWTYTKPAAKRFAPTNPYWSWPTACFTPADMQNGKTGIQIEFFYAKTASETPEQCDWNGYFSTNQIYSMDILDNCVEEYGAGYYYFRVRTMSTDITQYNHSDWSPMSSAYYCGTGFMDVDMGTYYAEPVKWAVDRGITTGQDATHFGPDATCTRGQIVTFLWRANGSPEPKSSNNPFYDVSSSDYFYKAVLWAVENGITSGVSANSFAPNDPCTRGQVATFLWRAKGQPSANAANGFYDVAPGAYYYNAVLWAVANGVTNGMGDGSFAPDAPCTRGQIVTFLYRAMA